MSVQLPNFTLLGGYTFESGYFATDCILSGVYFAVTIYLYSNSDICYYFGRDAVV